jgi:hypothetical protein
VIDQADAVLQVVCGAFTFNSDNRYKFVPDDRIMDICRSLYPQWKFWLVCDSMEVESLMMDLDKKFGFDISRWHPDITLGEIVDSATATPHNRPDTAPS